MRDVAVLTARAGKFGVDVQIGVEHYSFVALSRSVRRQRPRPAPILPRRMEAINGNAEAGPAAPRRGHAQGPGAPSDGPGHRVRAHAGGVSVPLRTSRRRAGARPAPPLNWSVMLRWHCAARTIRPPPAHRPGMCGQGGCLMLRAGWPAPVRRGCPP
jgi:hypothetical protein